MRGVVIQSSVLCMSPPAVVVRFAASHFPSPIMRLPNSIRQRGLRRMRAVAVREIRPVARGDGDILQRENAKLTETSLTCGSMDVEAAGATAAVP
ncbi:hypothetical protein GCM10010220_19160 [Streptomyces parvulus]|nr:hypothetical protein GCM10010220_19160 [Streptomyces parvulus]